MATLRVYDVTLEVEIHLWFLASCVNSTPNVTEKSVGITILLCNKVCVKEIDFCILIYRNGLVLYLRCCRSKSEYP